jgi:hypothetical protein
LAQKFYHPRESFLHILLNIEYLKIYCLQKENQSFSFLIGPHNEIDGRRPKNNRKFLNSSTGTEQDILQEHAEPTTSLADQKHFFFYVAPIDKKRPVGDSKRSRRPVTGGRCC